MNSRRHILSLFVLILLLVSGTIILAATKPVQKKLKPKLGAIGTSQLPGDWCNFGTAYTLGKAEALNLNIESAEYRVTRIKIGKNAYVWPKLGKKFLVVNYTLHNPLPRDQWYGGGANIDWTVVDSRNENSSGEADRLRTTSETISQTLKPAQKIALFRVFEVAADGKAPKLIAANHSEAGKPVARYDLTGKNPKNKVKPIIAPYADSSDSSGATPLEEIQGVMGSRYQTGSFDMTVEKIEFTRQPIEGETPDDGYVYALATVEMGSFEEFGSQPGLGAGPSYELNDTEGSVYSYWQTPLSLSSTRKISPEYKCGEYGKFRVAFKVPAGITLKSLIMKENEGRPVVIDLAGCEAR